MKKFNLKTNDGEIIHTVNADCMSDAIDILSQIKQLPVITLLNIFKIEED